MYFINLSQVKQKYRLENKMSYVKQLQSQEQKIPAKEVQTLRRLARKPGWFSRLFRWLVC